MTRRTFYPYYREGEIENASAAQGDLRAPVAVDLKVSVNDGDGIDTHTVAPRTTAGTGSMVYARGPLDVAGLTEAKGTPLAVIRAEPPPDTGNAAPNYLAHLEFAEPDFCWRYTPASATGGQLRPWLALLLFTDEELADAGGSSDGQAPAQPVHPPTLQESLPSIKVNDGVELPDPAAAWSWAHVQVSGESHPQTLQALAELIRTEPRRVISRLLCTRRLAPGTRYHAFLVPTYESGRRAGLGPMPFT